MEPTTPAPTPPPVAPSAPAPAAPSSFVSPDYTGPSNSPFNQQNGFRIFIALLAVVIIGELVWAGYTLTRPVEVQDTDQPVVITSPSPTPAVGTITLSGPTEATVGAVLNVEVLINSSEPTDGVDAVIKYDPKVLSATTVTTGTIYPDYPMKTIDAAAGTVSISGLSSPDGTGFSGQGLLGTITFRVLRAGQTNVAIEYVAESTTDSNILGSKAAKDILTQVQNLTLTIK